MVLEIKNRTENWKTARSMSSMFGDGAVHLARRLGEARETRPADVKLELFWKGVRDHRARPDTDKQQFDKELVGSYRCSFEDLGKRIEDYGGFRPRARNYDVSNEHESMLVNNLVNAEIDIVLESPEHLYIGEAKYESGFGRDGKLVLVHQLVRQYVMAKVLLDVLKCNKEVVPFVVVEGTKGRTYSSKEVPGLPAPRGQLAFVIDQGWMKACNRLTWDDVATLDSQSRDGGGQ